MMPDHDSMTRGARVFYGPSFIWAIERQVDQTQCLSLLLQRWDFTHGIRGIDNASQEYFGDSLAHLADDQYLELIMKFNNPLSMIRIDGLICGWRRRPLGLSRS